MNTRILLALLLVASIGSISAMSFEEEAEQEQGFDSNFDSNENPQYNEPSYRRPKSQRNHPNVFDGNGNMFDDGNQNSEYLD